MKNANVTSTESQIRVAPLTEMLAYDGTYGVYGGAYVPPALESKLKELCAFFDQVAPMPDFQKAFINTLQDFIGRPHRFIGLII